MSNRFKTDDNPSNICLTSADIQKECTVGFGLSWFTFVTDVRNNITS